jgi:hypothetical protein
VPVCPDGFGNFYLLVTERVDAKGECPIVFVNGISLEVEGVAGSNYWRFLSAYITDLTKITLPDGEPFFDLDTSTEWPFTVRSVIEQDPEAAHWFQVFGLE